MSDGGSENIGQFPDGYAYSTVHLATALGQILKKHQPSTKVKSEKEKKMRAEVATIIHEFEIPRAQAEKVFSENGEDLGKALRALVA
ncbi:hypothetical protein F5I97DRAFT_1844594, partial [Phlebopus sp. FC_14]